MKKTGRCPKCNTDDILHVKEVADENVVDQGSPQVAHLAKTVVKVKPALFGEPIDMVDTQGPLEAYVCGTCGLVEHYVDPETLTVDGVHIRRLAPKDGYR